MCQQRRVFRRSLKFILRVFPSKLRGKALAYGITLAPFKSALEKKKDHKGQDKISIP